jgi:serine protease Do
VNGKPVESSGDLTRQVALVPPGEKVEITVLRKGSEKSFSFPVANRPDDLVRADGDEPAEQGSEASKSPKLGVKLQALTPELAKQLKVDGDEGVVVADVTADGPADRAGVARGDLILEVNRKPVASANDVVAAVGKLKDGDIVLLRVRRGDSALFVTVPVGGR